MWLKHYTPAKSYVCKSIAPARSCVCKSVATPARSCEGISILAMQHVARLNIQDSESFLFAAELSILRQNKSGNPLPGFCGNDVETAAVDDGLKQKIIGVSMTMCQQLTPSFEFVE